MKSKDIVKVERLNLKKEFVIRWQLTSLCNYNCPFCIQGSKEEHLKAFKNENPQKRKEILENLLYFIENNIDGKYDSLRIYLIGGEVTILKDFFLILSKLVKCKFKGNLYINLKTNASFDEKFKKKLKRIMYSKTKYMRKMIFSCSFYKDYNDEETFVNKINGINEPNFIQKKLIKKNKNKILLTATYPILSDEDFYKYMDFKNKYKENFHSIDCIIIRNYNVHLSDKVLKQINQEDNESTKKIKITDKNNKTYELSAMRKLQALLNGKEFSPKGYKCESGIHSISIENDGKVYRCVYNYDNTYIGDLSKEKNLKMPKRAFECQKDECACSYFIRKIYKEIDKKR